MKQLDADQIVEQLAGLADKIKQDVLKDLVADLKEFMLNDVAEEHAGVQASIEFIESNYLCKK